MGKYGQTKYGQTKYGFAIEYVFDDGNGSDKRYCKGIYQL